MIVLLFCQMKKKSATSPPTFIIFFPPVSKVNAQRSMSRTI